MVNTYLYIYIQLLGVINQLIARGPHFVAGFKFQHVTPLLYYSIQILLLPMIFGYESTTEFDGQDHVKTFSNPENQIDQ